LLRRRVDRRRRRLVRLARRDPRLFGGAALL
jgi:hypothetical protein